MFFTFQFSNMLHWHPNTLIFFSQLMVRTASEVEEEYSRLLVPDNSWMDSSYRCCKKMGCILAINKGWQNFLQGKRGEKSRINSRLSIKSWKWITKRYCTKILNRVKNEKHFSYWRDCSVFKDINSFSKTTQIQSILSTYMVSQLFITPILGISVPSSGFCGYQTHMYCPDIDGSKIPIHIKITFKI